MSSKEQQESKAKNGMMKRLKNHYEKQGKEVSHEQLHRETQRIQEKHNSKVNR